MFVLFFRLNQISYVLILLSHVQWASHESSHLTLTFPYLGNPNEKNHSEDTVKHKSYCEESVDCDLWNCGWEENRYFFLLCVTVPRTFHGNVMNIGSTYKLLRESCRRVGCRMPLRNRTNLPQTSEKHHLRGSQSSWTRCRWRRSTWWPTSTPLPSHKMHIQLASQSESNTFLHSMGKFRPFPRAISIGERFTRLSCSKLASKLKRTPPRLSRFVLFTITKFQLQIVFMRSTLVPT